MNFETSKAWADKFIPQQYQILNSCLTVLDFNKVKKRPVAMSVAPEYDDQNLETDVIMFANLRIALRVRSGSSSDYRDIALRSYKPSGARTEVQKLKEGFGDYYLYCWTKDNISITEWMLIDLDKFRPVMDSCLKIYDFFNNDGSAFNTYDIEKILQYGCCDVISQGFSALS